jgi:hypothetical protein
MSLASRYSPLTMVTATGAQTEVSVRHAVVAGRRASVAIARLHGPTGNRQVRLPPPDPASYDQAAGTPAAFALGTRWNLHQATQIHDVPCAEAAPRGSPRAIVIGYAFLLFGVRNLVRAPERSSENAVRSNSPPDPCKRAPVSTFSISMTRAGWRPTRLIEWMRYRPSQMNQLSIARAICFLQSE